MTKDDIEAYAYLSIASSASLEALKSKAAHEAKMNPTTVAMEGKKRAEELQREIEAKIAAKKAGK